MGEQPAYVMAGLDEARIARQQILDAVNDVEQKLGVVFGFAAALVALGAVLEPTGLAVPVSIVAAVAVFTAGYGLWPTRYEVSKARTVPLIYSRARSASTPGEAQLAAWHYRQAEEAGRRLKGKVDALRAAIFALCLATVFAALSAFV